MSAHSPGFRPANHTRSIVHAIGGVVAVLLVQHVLTPDTMVWVAVALFVWAWSMEISRQHFSGINRLLMWAFRPIAHSYEVSRVNSATWYVTALLALSLTASPMACSLAVIVLGIGDPAAAYVGRRWGRTRFKSGRSVEGALGFVAFAGIAAAITLQVYYPELGVQAIVAIALASAVAGAIAELATASLDDNLVIPLATAASATLVAAAFG